MSELNEELVARLKAHYGVKELVPFSPGDGQKLVVRGPKPSEWARFVDKITDDKQGKASSQRELVVCCTVYPCDDDLKVDVAAVEAALDKLPALVTRMMESISELGGAGIQPDTKL